MGLNRGGGQLFQHYLAIEIAKFCDKKMELTWIEQYLATAVASMCD